MIYSLNPAGYLKVSHLKITIDVITGFQWNEKPEKCWSFRRFYNRLISCGCFQKSQVLS